MATLVETVRANEEVFESLRPGLEQEHWGQWVVIADGEVVTIAATWEDAVGAAGTARTEGVSRLIRRVGEELPTRVRKL